MTDPRVVKLADVLVGYACAVKAGENVLLEAIDVPHAFTTAMVRRIKEAGGKPYVWLKSNEVNRALMNAGTDDQWNTIADFEKSLMEKAQCYIGARGNFNVS